MGPQTPDNFCMATSRDLRHQIISVWSYHGTFVVYYEMGASHILQVKYGTPAAGVMSHMLYLVNPGCSVALMSPASLKPPMSGRRAPVPVSKRPPENSLKIEIDMKKDFV